MARYAHCVMLLELLILFHILTKSRFREVAKIIQLARGRTGKAVGLSKICQRKNKDTTMQINECRDFCSCVRLTDFFTAVFVSQKY